MEPESKEITLTVATGFQTSCDPHGSAECRIEGEMNIASVEDVIQLMHLIIDRLYKRIDLARQRNKFSGVIS